jgi:hypothetical protein
MLNPNIMTSSNISTAKGLLADYNAMHSLMQTSISLSIYYTLVHRFKSAFVCSKEQVILN